MAWLPISWTVPQYVDSNGDPYSGAVLKFYNDGTTTVINMATSNTGATQLSSVALDSNGNPANGGSVFIPHIDQAYKISLYPTQTAANANTGAIWTIDNLSPADLTDTDTDELTKVSSNDTTAGYLNGKLTSGTGITLTENSDGGNETLDITATATSSVVTNHVRAGSTQIWDGDAASASVGDLDANVTEAAWTSVGPTNSGADYIWDALDVLPARARILLVVFKASFTSNAAGVTSVVFNMTDGDSTNTSTIENQTLGAQFEFDADAINEAFRFTDEIHIPLNSSRVFRCRWATINTTASSSIHLIYRGFMTD